MKNEHQSPLEIIEQYSTDAPVNLLAIANALGLAVEYKDLGNSIAGMIKKAPSSDGNFEYSISISDKDGHNRKRFTLAHEIAHYILHKDLIGDGITDDALYRSGLTNQIEAQANRFAAAILMPWELIDKLRTQYNADVTKIAKALEVSEQALKIKLGIIDN